MLGVAGCGVEVSLAEVSGIDGPEAPDDGVDVPGLVVTGVVSDWFEADGRFDEGRDEVVATDVRLLVDESEATSVLRGSSTSFTGC